MASVFDVAQYILQKKGKMTAMKLQKLVYYAQAWSLVWDEEPLFSDAIEAWANGPVVPTLYQHHCGEFTVNQQTFEQGDGDNLTEVQKETIDQVLEFYGPKSSHWLSNLTHQESPWIQARSGLSPGERGSNEIKISSLFEYYDSL